MQHAPIVADRHRHWPAPATWLALLLVVVLSAVWAARDWAALAAFRLPDNDDMMRLAQVRDWVDGQAFADLTQHRLGPPGGASMHWSRIADAGPAAIIVILTPLIGRTGAEQAMLVLYPAALFLAALITGARVAERLAPGTRATAVVVLALAFPMASLFVPGRIDHHGLQILLMLVMAERLMADRGWASGAGMGAAAAISLAIGLETLPLVLFAMAALAWGFVAEPHSDRHPELVSGSIVPQVQTSPVEEWTLKQVQGDGRMSLRGADPQLTGFALALGGLTLLFLAVLKPQIWPAIWCDGFTPASTAATFAAAAVFAALGLGAAFLHGWKARIATGAVLGGIALPVVYATSSVCLTGPYGALDPMLQTLWMGKVGEALGLWQQDSPGVAVSYGAFGFVGLAALAVILKSGAWRSRAWQGFAILLTLGVLLSIAQIRVTYVVSGFAAIPVAILIHRIRAHATAPLLRVGAWVLGAGLTYNLIGLTLDDAVAPKVVAAKIRMAQCTGPDQVAALAKLPPARLMAPLDSGAYLIGGTRHAVIAAPYHRNNPGNLAMYRFFLGSPDAARRIAAEWGATHVVLCRDSFGELGAMADDPRRLIGRIRNGHAPGWLAPVATSRDGPLVFAITSGL